MSLIVLDRLKKVFGRGEVIAVDGLCLEVRQGETLALLGPSGCGKTTVLRLIAGFEVPDGGSITIRSQLVSGSGRWVPPEDRGVGIVFQEYALFPHLSVADNVAFGLFRFDAAVRERRVTEVLELVGLSGQAHRFTHQLSGGQQQRVAVARALAPAPAVVLLDEPFSNLDVDLRTQMREEIEKILRNTGTTALFVTHDQEEAFTLADRVGVLNRGRLEQLDRAEEIYHHPASRFVAEFVGVADFVPGRVKEEGIVTALGIFPNLEGRPLGMAVDVMIRPDDIDFIPHPDGEAIVSARQFRGYQNLYRLRLPSGLAFRSSQPSTTICPSGTRVRVVADLIHVVTFPAEGPNAD